MRLFSWARREASRSEGKVAPAPEPVATSAVAHATVKTREDPTKRGVSLLGEGKFLAACEAFKEALAVLPETAEAHVNLAFALEQAGSAESAISHLHRAVELDGQSFDAYYLLGLALERVSKYDDACASLRKALEISPEFEQSYADLCRVLALSGDAGGAKHAIDAGIARFPNNASFHHYVGNLQMTAGDPTAALGSYSRELALSPDDAQAHLNVGLALTGLKKFGEAIPSFQRAVEIDPASAAAHVNLGRALKAEGRLAEAATSLRRALEIQPDDADTLNELGSALQKQGELDPAVELYARAIKLKPDLPGGYTNLGLALFEKGEVAHAIAIFRAGLAVKPLAETHDNLGIALQANGSPDEAIEHFEKALEITPDNPFTQCNLAGALADGGDPRQAISVYRQILELRPEHLISHSNLLFNLSVDEQCGAQGYLEEARRFDRKLVGQTGENVSLPARRRGARLRLGFVSADLRGHPVGYFLEGILQHLDRSRFELFAYPTIAKEDALTARIRPLFAGWHMLKGLSDEAAAQRIRADQIDILLDLSGHTGDNRLGVFALRAAPVQITWLGYFASTGLSAMDYVLADEVCVPPGSDHLFTERVWRLPRTRLCFTPPAEGSTPNVGPLPASTRGHITFGCFQRLPKINDRVLALWKRIFAALPNARLLLQSPQTGRPKYIEQIRSRLAEVGIDADRVTIRGPAARSTYLESYAEVDIVLDTFPFTGGTTTCEALWMGVPTLTLAGESMIARQGAALLRAGDLAEWVAETEDGYVEKAISFATDAHALARLRSTMRSRMKASALFDVRLFAANFGVALDAIWDERISGTAKAGIDPAQTI